MDNEERCDRLSHLPEALLTSILSMIPTKQAAATSILSRRWRYHWHSITHLRLLHENFFPTSDDDDRSAIEVWESMLNSIQLSIHGPIGSCRISFNPSHHLFDNYILRLNAFLLSLVDKGIEELSVVNKGTGCYQLPSETFFCPTMRRLELGKCMLSILPSPSSLHQLSSIRSLILFRVYFTNDQFQQMISCCKLLESLKVDCCVKVRHFKICAPKLLSLEITTLRRIRISLTYITLLRQASFKFQLASDDNTSIHYYNDSSREEDDHQAKKLIQLLTALSNGDVKSLSLHFCAGFAECLQLQRVEVPLSLPPQYYLQAVKKLNLEISLSNLQVATILSCLLNSCPNLYELRIQDKEHLDTTESYWESQNPSHCLINHLRIIDIRGVNLHRSYWTGFVEFLLMNACLCERVTIHYISDPWGKTVVEQKLQMFQWASPHALLELKSLS